VKVEFFPSFKEADFALSSRNLQQVSSGLVVVRPTCFARSHYNGIVSTTVLVFGKPARRTMGRNVSFKDLMATACGQTPERVLLPSDAPKTNFDFLVTARVHQQQKLREAIRKKLGFVARMESHETDVLALKVANPSLPGLAVSGADQKEHVEFKDGRLCFTHVPVAAFTVGLEQALGRPVVDRTGLTNLYNLSLAWDPQLQRELQNGPTARAAVDRILKAWGLTLKLDTARVEMLVVKRAD